MGACRGITEMSGRGGSFKKSAHLCHHLCRATMGLCVVQQTDPGCRLPLFDNSGYAAHFVGQPCLVFRVSSGQSRHLAEVIWID